jgi:RNA polymerase sigma-70 factor, ECF subfamily
VSVDPGFRAMYEREFGDVYRTVLLLCGDRGLAEDATQEAVARALVRWRRLKTHPRPAGWVTTTAMNIARRQLRRRPSPLPGEAPRGADVEGALDLRRAIGKLPHRQQEAAALHYLLDLSVAETAIEMGCDEGTVKTHLSRARAALARDLGETNDDRAGLRAGPTRSDDHDR